MQRYRAQARAVKGVGGEAEGGDGDGEVLHSAFLAYGVSDERGERVALRTQGRAAMIAAQERAEQVSKEQGALKAVLRKQLEVDTAALRNQVSVQSRYPAFPAYASDTHQRAAKQQRLTTLF